MQSNQKRTVNYLFYECSFTNLIWNDFASFWSLVSSRRVVLTLQDMLQGKLHAEMEILNYYVALVNLYIWISRKRGVTSSLSAFKEIVKVKFRTDIYTTVKNNTKLNFQARLETSLKFISET